MSERPEIAARGGKYPQTERGEQAVARLIDILRVLIDDPVCRALVLRETCTTMIEQHNASWDAAMVERLITTTEPNPRAA